MIDYEKFTPRELHPRFKHLIGKEVIVTVGKSSYCPDILYFAGRNVVGHNIVVTKRCRCLLHIKDWSQVSIELSQNN